MVDIPGPDTVEMLEKRVGKRFTTALVWLGVIAFAVLALGTIVAAVTVTVGFLRPYVPTAAWTDWLVRAGIVVIYVVGFIVLWRKLRRLEIYADLQERLNQVEKAEAEMKSETGKRVDALEARTAETTKALSNVENRVKYVESKVGDKLFDVLMDQVLSQKGYKRGDIVYRLIPIAARQPVTKQEEIRLAQARELLKEAAATAKMANDPGNDFDRLTNQGWFSTQMQRFISENFTFEVYKDFGNFLDGREMKMKQRDEKDTGRKRLVAMADYFEELANRLTLEDIDSEAKLLSSFAEFAKGPGR